MSEKLKARLFAVSLGVNVKSVGLYESEANEESGRYRRICEEVMPMLMLAAPGSLEVSLKYGFTWSPLAAAQVAGQFAITMPWFTSSTVPVGLREKIKNSKAF